MADTEKLSKADSDEAIVRRRLGSTIAGKWKLDGVLGIGAFAAVYEATHNIGRKSAIKILHPEVAGSAEWVERFNREALVANELSHDAVVEIHDVDVTEEGLPYLVMDLVEGETLTKRLASAATLSPDDLLPLMDQLLDCLAVAHRAGIIHRDIKPSNLMLDQDDHLRVLDFGVARILRGDKGGKRLTEPGTALGTVAYMAPEQLRGEDVTAQVDLYAVGALMFRALSGRQVHGAGSDDVIAKQILEAPAPKLRSVTEDVPEEIANIVDRALAFKAEDRYADARSMQNEVRKILDLPPAEDPPEETEPPEEDAARRGPRGTLIQGDEDEASTVKRDVVNEDATTLPRKALGNVSTTQPETPAITEAGEDDPAPKAGSATEIDAPAEPQKPSAPARLAEGAPAEEPSSARGVIIGLVALAVVVGLGVMTYRWAFADGDEDTDARDETQSEPDDDDDRGNDDDSDDDDDDGDGDGGDDDDPAVPSADPDADPSAVVGSGGASPTPKPGAPAGPASSASATPAAPFPLPPGLPSTFPSGLPSSFPTSIPTEIPTVFPPPPPPPSAQPAPVPPPTDE